MAKKRSSAKESSSEVTAKRVARMYRLLGSLGTKPQTRAALTKRMGVGVRDFYRDLEVLRNMGIEITLVKGRYVLSGKLADAEALVPFPDPGLTLAEARQLAKGRTAAHRKLKSKIDAFTK
jgi:predicted DNA-binding transcriptional regulator YafY